MRKMIVAKKAHKSEEEKINEAISILNRFPHITIPSFLKIVNSYFKNQELTVEPTLPNFPEYLGSILEKYPDSIVKVVHPEDNDLNPLAYYKLKYKNIE